MKRIINLLTILLPLTLLCTSCIKREPAFKPSSPECTPESTSLTCMGERERKAAAAAKEKPDRGKSKFDLTPGPSCGGDDTRPVPRAETGKPKKFIVPEPDPAKVNNMSLLKECLDGVEKAASEDPPTWIEEYEANKPKDEVQKHYLVKDLDTKRRWYQKCVSVMNLYIDEGEEFTKEGSDRSQGSFTEYYDSRGTETRRSRMVYDYAEALVSLVSWDGYLPGYNFYCEDDCQDRTRYELVKELVGLMKHWKLAPESLWKSGNGTKLREWSKMGYQELYKAWVLAKMPAAARIQLHEKLCRDLPESGNLKPLMTVELEALNCEGKKTEFGECQQFKQVTWWPDCPRYAFQETNGTCVFDETVIDTADICARLQAKYGTDTTPP